MYVKRLKGSPNRKSIARLRFFRLSWLLRHCKHIFNMPCMYTHVYIIYIYIYIVYVCIYLLFYRLRPNIKHIAHIRSRRIEGWLVRCISRNNNNNSWFSWVAAVPGPGTPSRNVWWFAWWFINPGSPSSSFPAHAQRIAPHPRMRFKVARPSFGP